MIFHQDCVTASNVTVWYSKTFWCLNHCTLPDFSRGPFKISSLLWFSKTPQWYTLVWGSWRFPVLGTWGLLSDLEPLSFGEFGGYYFFAPFHFSLLRLSRLIFSSSFSSNVHLFFFLFCFHWRVLWIYFLTVLLTFQNFWSCIFNIQELLFFG